MSQFFNDDEIKNSGGYLINLGPQVWRKKTYEFLRKCFFSRERLLKAEKRQQIGKT